MSTARTPRLLALPAAALIAVGLGACGSGNGGTSGPTSPTSVSTAPATPSVTAPSSPATTSPSLPASGTPVTQDQAQQIALAAAGAGAVVRHVSPLHLEHGQMVWTFEIAVGGQLRDISVAQATGQVVNDEIHH